MKTHALTLAGLLSIAVPCIALADTIVEKKTILECSGAVVNHMHYYSEREGKEVDTSSTSATTIEIIRSRFIQNGVPSKPFIYGEMHLGYTYVFPELKETVDSVPGRLIFWNHQINEIGQRSDVKIETTPVGNQIKAVLQSRSEGIGSDFNGVDSYQADDLTCKIP